MVTLPMKSASPANRIVFGVVLAAAIGIGLWFGRTPTSAPDLRGIEATVLEPPRTINAFDLVDHNGRAFGLNALAGKWSFLFFGFSHCPDICPPTLQILAQVERKIGDRRDLRDNTRFVFVTVDPERDTPTRMKDYLAQFSPSLIGLTGTRDGIMELTRDLGIFHGTDGTPHAINHSGVILLADDQARLRAIFSAPHEAGSLAREFIKITKL